MEEQTSIETLFASDSRPAKTAEAEPEESLLLPERPDLEQPESLYSPDEPHPASSE